MITKIRIVGSGNTDELQTEANKLLDKLTMDIKKEGYPEDSVIQLNFFVSQTLDFANARRTLLEIIKKRFAHHIPATNIIAQSPLPEASLIVEYIIPDTVRYDYKIKHKSSGDNIFYTLCEGRHFKLLFAAGLTHEDSRPVCRIEKTFASMNAILAGEEMHFGHVIRQWNYVHDITKTSMIDGNERQHYQILNDIRAVYYGKHDFPNGYPAATGIGMHAGGFVLEFIAMKGNSDLQIFPLENPLQVNAYQYSQNMLIGASLDDNSMKAPPLFERAKVVSFSKRPVILVSGTASIHNEKSVAIGDAGEQTRITLENIQQLISQISKSQAIESTTYDQIKFEYARVYIKKQADYMQVKSLCDAYFKDADIQYLVSDVCREELLVEIEGIAEAC